jgi:LmbE family N-acetylglucosaminyl deacetylase
LEETRPDIIYLPHQHDGHPDHRATLPILRATLKHFRALKPRLLAYEVWTPLVAHDVSVDISKVMPRKIRALRAHRSQLGEFDYGRAVSGLNQFRGALAGKCRFAEVFQTLAPGR